MPADRSQRIRYSDFSGGDYGETSPDRAPANTFSAKNMVVYNTGLIGPRAGVKSLGFSSKPTGVVMGMFWRGTNPDLAVIVGTSVYRGTVTSPGAMTTFTGALASTPTQQVRGFEYGNKDLYITSFGDKSYVLDFVGGTLTALTGSPGGYDIALYGERMMVTGASGFLTRVYYSDAGDFTTWGATNWFDVPNSSGAATGGFAQRNQFSVMTQNGEWHALTGLPTTGTLRRVTGGGVHPWTAFADCAALLGSDQIIFVPISADYPAVFNGSTVQEKRYLRLNDTTAQLGLTTIKVVKGFRPDEAVVLFPLTDKGGLYRNGVWTRHTFGVDISVYATSDGQGHIHLTDGGGVASQPNFWIWSIDNSRPAFTSDTYAQPGDASTTPLDAEITFPEFWAEEGNEVRVRKVTVDFTKWDTGSATANGFTVTPTSHSRWETPDGLAATAQTWSEASASSTTSGVRTRKTFLFGPESRFGGGISLKLSAVKGVAFQDIIVELDVRPKSPRS